MTRLVAVVAMARNRVIGRDGDMPWRLQSDLRRYRRLTMNKPMIMGRKTLQSIGCALDGRDSIVLTRGNALPVSGAHRATSPEEALAMAAAMAEGRGAEEIVVAGGAEIYELFFDRLERLYVTHVDAEPEGDARFPAIVDGVWRGTEEEIVPAGEKDSVGTSFLVYDRR